MRSSTYWPVTLFVFSGCVWHGESNRPFTSMFQIQNKKSRSTTQAQEVFRSSGSCKVSTLSIKRNSHFFRTTLTKFHCIKINNFWTQISFNTPYEPHKKKQVVCVQILEQCSEIIKVNFFKNHRNFSLSELHGDSLFRTFNSYSFDFNGRLCNCRTGFCPWRAPSPGGEQFCDFFKMTTCNFIAFFSFFGTSKPLFFSDMHNKQYFSLSVS